MLLKKSSISKNSTSANNVQPACAFIIWMTVSTLGV
jgi:hypothetical protein